MGTRGQRLAGWEPLKAECCDSVISLQLPSIHREEHWLEGTRKRGSPARGPQGLRIVACNEVPAGARGSRQAQTRQGLEAETMDLAGGPSVGQVAKGAKGRHRFLAQVTAEAGGGEY